MGYPSKDGPAAVGYTQQRLPEETKTRGDGFWEGWGVLIAKITTP